MHELLRERKGEYICGLQKGNGPVAERLGTALQKLLLRFESGRDLQETLKLFSGFFYA